MVHVHSSVGRVQSNSHKPCMASNFKLLKLEMQLGDTALAQVLHGHTDSTEWNPSSITRGSLEQYWLAVVVGGNECRFVTCMEKQTGCFQRGGRYDFTLCEAVDVWGLFSETRF